MNANQRRRLLEDVDKSPEMQMRQRRDHVILMRAHSAIDRTKHMVEMEIKQQQRMVHKNFQVRIHCLQASFMFTKSLQNLVEC